LIDHIKNSAENAKQLEVREATKETLVNLDNNMSYTDNHAVLESGSFVTKISQFFK
jgi:hypothetical protein